MRKIATALILSVLALSSVPAPAKAGCGWLDPTCDSGPGDCLFGACPGGRGGSESHLPVMPPNRYTITYNNFTGQTIMRLFVSPTSSNDWGGDILGDRVLPPNYYWRLEFLDDNGCQYDLMAHLRDGTTRTIRNFNACRVGNLDIR